MDERDFIRSHFQDGKSYNTPGAINININPVTEGSSEGIITSIIIHVEAHSIDGQTDETRIDGVLEQIEKVKFNVEGKLYELDITSKQYYPAKVPFIYYTIEPEIIDDIYDANLVGTVHKNIEVTFSPFLKDVVFGFSPHNPLISNAELNRKSKVKMTSERSRNTNNPSNINALLELTAPKAVIQDSLYSDTGWINARYNGSQTTAAESAGIPPTIFGRTFTGEVFSSDSDIEYICALDNRVKQELFHTGVTESPTFTTSSIEIVNTSTMSKTTVKITPSDSDLIKNGTLKIGDILKAPVTDDYPDKVEFMRISDIITDTTPTTTPYIEVTRDILRSFVVDAEIPEYSVNVIFVKMSESFEVLKFGTGQNRIQLVNNSKIYVEGNNTVVITDDYGRIVSATQCPYIGYRVDPV